MQSSKLIYEYCINDNQYNKNQGINMKKKMINIY